MVQVRFLPSEKTVDVAPGTDVLEAARQAGIEIETPCGGDGSCGECLVRVLEGEIAGPSGVVSPSRTVGDLYALACQTQVLDRSVSLDVPEQVGSEGGLATEGDTEALVRPDLLPRPDDLEPIAVKRAFTVPSPMPEDGLSDLDRVARSIRDGGGPSEVSFALSAMRAVATAVRAPGGLVTTTLLLGDQRAHVIAVEPGDRTGRHFGIAIDLGTTTVAVRLLDLATRQAIATRSDYNGQVPCGADVISRINYARKPGHLEELRSRALETINRLTHELAGTHGVDKLEIREAVISGNTVMTHLFLGLGPEHIRLAPYTPTVLFCDPLAAGELSLDIHPESRVHLSPCVGSYVGGDITAGLLCTDLAADTEEVNLFLDIGTNGELVIGNRDFLMACACSAGPAFEGMGIRCGMRAAVGAIEKVSVDAVTGRPNYATIGSAPPRGLCGSGMVDLVANLLLTGWIDPAGKLDRSRPCSHVRVGGKRASYVIAPAEEGLHGEAISISEAEIDNIVRAKAAIYSASTFMLARVGMTFSDLANVYVGGGFGRFLDLDNAKVIGLVPDLPADRFHYLGNTSLMGSHMLAVSRRHRRRQLDLAQRMTYVELSTDPQYMDHYTAALFLPHTDLAQFPSVSDKVARTRRRG